MEGRDAHTDAVVGAAALGELLKLADVLRKNKKVRSQRDSSAEGDAVNATRIAAFCRRRAAPPSTQRGAARCTRIRHLEHRSVSCGGPLGERAWRELLLCTGGE